MATEEKTLSEKLGSAMVLTRESSPESKSDQADIYTSELRGSDESGEGTYKVPYKTILQAMRRHGKEPFPIIYQDPKPDSDAAKSGNQMYLFSNSFNREILPNLVTTIFALY